MELVKILKQNKLTILQQFFVENLTLLHSLTNDNNVTMILCPIDIALKSMMKNLELNLSEFTQTKNFNDILLNHFGYLDDKNKFISVNNNEFDVIDSKIDNVRFDYLATMKKHIFIYKLVGVLATTEQIDKIQSQFDDKVNFIPDIIYKEIGTNVADIFIMNYFQKKYPDLLFVVPFNETSTALYGRWKLNDFNVPKEMLQECEKLWLTFRPRIIAINVSISVYYQPTKKYIRHRNLIVIDTEKQILTYFEPNLWSKDMIMDPKNVIYKDFQLAIESNYYKFASSIEKAFTYIFPKLQKGLVWKNISVIINYIAQKYSNNTFICSSRAFGWCTLDTYAFLEQWIKIILNGGDLTTLDNRKYFETTLEILQNLSLYYDEYDMYKNNKLLYEDIRKLLPQLE